MKPEKAWEAAVGQLQMEMPRAAFETWVKDAQLVSYDADGFTIGVFNAYARDWLENRLSSTLSRLLTGIMNSPVDVNFIVWDGADGQDTAPEPDDEAEDLQLKVQVVHQSLRDAFTEPHKVVVVPGYFRRWVPFLEPTLASIIVAFRQVMYLSTRKEATTNCHFSTSPQQVANWAGIDRTTLWRNMKDHRLRWFLKRVDEKDHVYEFTATMPLTPGDETLLYDWLVEAGARSDPIQALHAALETPVKSIWPDPPPAPVQEHLEMEPKPHNVQAVVLDACGNIKASAFDEVSELADQLAVYLMPPQDLIVISHYFLKNWVQVLGNGPAWLITLLRDECYIGKEEVRNTVWVQGGNGELSSMLGFKKRGSITVSEWLPPMPDSQFARPSHGPRTKDPKKIRAYEERVRRREAKRELIGRFLQRVDHQDGNDATAWKFKVSILEPLIDEHKQQYDLITGIVKDYIKRNHLQSLKDILYDYAIATSHYADATGDNAIATLSPKDITRLQQVITRLQQDDNANATTDYAVETEHLRVRDALNTLNHYKTPLTNLLNHVENPNNFVTTSDEKKKNDRIINKNTMNKLVVVGEVPEKWQLESLLTTSQLHPGTRRKIQEQQIEAWMLVSHMLYAHSRTAGSIHNPMAIVGSAITNQPESGFGGPYDLLAQLPPKELAGLIEKAHHFAVQYPNEYYHDWTSGNQAWDLAMGQADPQKLLWLAIRLGIGKV